MRAIFWSGCLVVALLGTGCLGSLPYLGTSKETTKKPSSVAKTKQENKTVAPIVRAEDVNSDNVYRMRDLFDRELTQAQTSAPPTERAQRELDRTLANRETRGPLENGEDHFIMQEER